MQNSTFIKSFSCLLGFTLGVGFTWATLKNYPSVICSALISGDETLPRNNLSAPKSQPDREHKPGAKTYLYKTEMWAIRPAILDNTSLESIDPGDFDLLTNGTESSVTYMYGYSLEKPLRRAPEDHKENITAGSFVYENDTQLLEVFDYITS